MAINKTVLPTPSWMALVLLVAASVSFIAAVQAGIDISQINVNDIQQQLPAELSNTNFTLDDAKALLRDKCVAVSGEEKGQEAFEAIEAGTMTLGECISGIVNYTAIQAEIDEASPRGELDVVFNKYCNKRPEAVECIETFNSKIVPCLDADERENQEVFMRIVRSLLSFVCHKGGDQIALFIAEKGPECLESKKDDIQQCINSTFADYMPKDGIENVKSLPKFVMGQKQCDDMYRLETCIVEKLEKCDEITPANIVESMFRFIKNETICRSTTTSSLVAKPSDAKSAANCMLLTANSSSVLTLLVVMYYALSKRLQG